MNQLRFQIYSDCRAPRLGVCVDFVAKEVSLDLLFWSLIVDWYTYS